MDVYNYILQMIPVFDSKEINLLLFSPEDLGVGKHYLFEGFFKHVLNLLTRMAMFFSLICLLYLSAMFSRSKGFLFGVESRNPVYGSNGLK